jgi:hypothetical protein
MSSRGCACRVSAAPVLAMWLAAASALLAGTASRACGLCDEDKVAATYDYGVVTTAASQHHRMLFAAFIGPVAVSDAALADRLTRALERTVGVDAQSARISLSPAAMSLAWDPGKTTRARLIAAMTRALAPHRLRLRPIEAVLPSAAVTPERTAPRRRAGSIP